ncbi:MAG: IS1182 family transposase [Lewinella sp.]|uniref:IS1182 family transposase n=1 Tax=Lewinella sp. TaxID=2004506 RepID=UPI003D6A3403
MSLPSYFIFDVPEETARVARQTYPKGNVYMKMRDELELTYHDSDFIDLYSYTGQAAKSPAFLALVSVMQFAEGLTDKQATQAVASRIDWKYALGLELTDTGFDPSVLSEFRKRLLDGEMERHLLDHILKQLSEKGLVKAGGRQRTDSTHVLAPVRKLNRVKCVAETMRKTLNDLATVVPEWLLEQVSPDWFDLYGPRFDSYRLPQSKSELGQLQLRIGYDGHHLLQAIYTGDTPQWLVEIPSVKIMRQVWIQQYYYDNGQLKWRTADQLPPNKLLIQSPYDPEARNRTKRKTNWTGYTVHLTETCDKDMPLIITSVCTTPATTTDGEMTEVIHQQLADKDCLPNEHFVDSGYTNADNFVSAAKVDIDLCGPVAGSPSWQAAAGQGFDIPHFEIDWAGQSATCPNGVFSRTWRDGFDKNGNEVIKIGFPRLDCLSCLDRAKCTTSKKAPRILTIRPQEQHEALQAARQRQTTDKFKEAYKIRAGCESVISYGVRTFGLRKTRYIGLRKTRLQHILTATAMNLTRTVAWMAGIPRKKTYISRFARLAA